MSGVSEGERRRNFEEAHVAGALAEDGAVEGGCQKHDREGLLAC